MRPISIIVCLLMIATCYAFKIASMEEFYQIQQKVITEESLKLKESLDYRLPVKSKATRGLVTRHHINFSGFSTPIFIIGDDPVSKTWLIEHAAQLRQLHALGFITNIKNPETLHALQTEFDLPLLPADVDDLMFVLEVNHYPLMMNEGVVWQ